MPETGICTYGASAMCSITRGVIIKLRYGHRLVPAGASLPCLDAADAQALNVIWLTNTLQTQT